MPEFDPKMFENMGQVKNALDQMEALLKQFDPLTGQIEVKDVAKQIEAVNDYEKPEIIQQDKHKVNIDNLGKGLDIVIIK